LAWQRRDSQPSNACNDTLVGETKLTEEDMPEEAKISNMHSGSQVAMQGKKAGGTHFWRATKHRMSFAFVLVGSPVCSADTINAAARAPYAWQMNVFTP
jgi:hypothetical protein